MGGVLQIEDERLRVLRYTAVCLTQVPAQPCADVLELHSYASFSEVSSCTLSYSLAADPLFPSHRHLWPEPSFSQLPGAGSFLIRILKHFEPRFQCHPLLGGMIDFLSNSTSWRGATQSLEIRTGEFSVGGALGSICPPRVVISIAFTRHERV